MKKILFLINYPTPYQIQFFNKLKEYFNIKVLFLYRKLDNYKFILKKQKKILLF